MNEWDSGLSLTPGNTHREQYFKGRDSEGILCPLFKGENWGTVGEEVATSELTQLVLTSLWEQNFSTSILGL